MVLAKLITRCYRGAPKKLVLLISGIYPASFCLKFMVVKRFFQVKQIRDLYNFKLSSSDITSLPVSSAIIRSLQEFGISYKTVVERRVFDYDGMHPSSRKEVTTLTEFTSNNKFGIYDKADVHIFTDGSKDQEGRTGCGFVFFEGADLLTPVARAAFHLPRYTSVYQAELVAIREALKVCIDERTMGCRKVCFHIDNKSAIFTSAAPSSKTSPLCFENYKLITESHINVSLCYIPAHKGYHGNELADELAKDGAANNPSSSYHKDVTVNNLHDIELSIGVLKGVLKTKIDQHIAQNWSSLFRSPTTLKFMPSIQHAHNIRTFLQTNPRCTKYRYLVWLLTGCCPLNHYLFRLKLKNSARCDGCGCADEDRNHFLDACPAYDAHRCAIVRKNWETLQRWPSSTPQWWLENTNNISILLDYIIMTKRFERSREEGVDDNSSSSSTIFQI
jgi:ribonuclease HI